MNSFEKLMPSFKKIDTKFKYLQCYHQEFGVAKQKNWLTAI